MKTSPISVQMLACITLAAATLTACDDANDELHPEICPGTAPTPYRCYLLAEGSYGQNNSTLAGFNGNGITPELYYTANGRNLGDTAQDLLWLGNSLYVTVSGSRYLAKLDLEGRETARYQFSEAQGSPRYMSTWGGDLYVSLWSGHIARFDTATLSLQGLCKAGASPEQMVVLGNCLVSADSGNGNDHTLTVIDLTTFTPMHTLEAGDNPARITAAGNGKAYFTITGYDASWTPTTVLKELDSRDWSIRTLRSAIGKGMTVTAADDDLYIVESETDYSAYPYATRNTFIEYDCDDDRFEPAEFLGNDLQQALAASAIYMLAVDPRTEELFIATTDYATHSVLYHIDDEGRLKARYDDAGGVNVSRTAFQQ